MANDTSATICPRCGGLVNTALAGGSCPACLLRAVALGTAADSLPAMPWVPPSVVELAPAFPQLEIVELIGHGGMGAVYKARQKSLGRWVALKILAPQHAAKPDFAERFSREAKVLAEVNHPHIVTVHDFGQAGEFYFLLMEFVDGVSLRQAMRAGRFTPEQALSIVPPICEALQFAHERGIVHRDIKPENLLLDKEGRVKIADFGIARMMRVGEGTQGASALAGKTGMSASLCGGASQASGTDIPVCGVDLTQNAVLGTPRYMAPEQRDRPASVDHRADIYSLGVVLYEMLTGELPGPSWQPPSRHSAADVRLDQIVQRALEQNPDLRYQSATELRTQIETSIIQLPPDVASRLLNATEDDPSSPEVDALISDMNTGFLQWDKLGIIIYFCSTIFVSHLIFGFPQTNRTSPEINALFYAFVVAILGGIGWIIGCIFVRRRGAATQQHDKALAASSATHMGLKGVFQTVMDEVFRTGLGTGFFLFGCFAILIGLWPNPNIQVFYRLIVFVGLAVLLKVIHGRNAKTPLPVQPLPAAPPRTQLDILAELFGIKTLWGRRCLMISWLGGFGFLGFVKGLEPMLGMFGFFGFLGVAAFIEHWAIPVEKSPAKQAFRKHWKLITGVAVAVAVYLGVALFVIPEFRTHANVVMRNPAMEGSYFVFDHEVECPPGWHVWVSLVCDPGISGREVERYQGKLDGTGHVRIPVRMLNPAIGATIPPKVHEYRLAPKRGAGWTLYGNLPPNTGGSVTLMMYPEGESPATRDRVPYTTIKPPSRPQSAPFVASYEQGKIEIVRLTPHPSDGQIQWMPNGQPCTEKFLPDRDGRSSSSGRVIKEITVRVLSNTRDPSWPVLRFPEKSGFGGMGGSFHRATDEQPATIMVQTIACPPEAREMTVEVGVADGEWKTEISFESGDYRSDRHHGSTTSGGPGGDWQGSVQVTDAVGDKLPVSFSYTHREDAETRLVYELADGKLVPMPGTSGLGTSRTGLMTIPVSEFEKIKQFHVQFRSYQWTEFRNVSLELGHQTEVEISDAY